MKCRHSAVFLEQCANKTNESDTVTLHLIINSNRHFLFKIIFLYNKLSNTYNLI